MRFKFPLRTACTLAIAAIFCSSCGPLLAQGGGGGGGNNNNNGGNNNNNNNNNNADVAGIDIDATGVLRVMQVDPSVATAQRMAALQNTPRGQLKTSPMRMVSLNRLESFVSSELAAGRELSTEVWGLAGLQRLEYVFYLPETKDIVIAGPADQWYVDATQRIVGLSSGRATLRLDDLIVALRAFGPNGGATRSIGCSIDPTPEGLKRMSQFNAQFGGQAPKDVRPLLVGMKNALGLQTVSIRGVPSTTHFARVLVEADYRMKLIGIGLQDPMVPMSTWIERSRPSAGSNALQRWYFEADYSTVASNESGNAMRLVGRGVKLSGELEGVQKDGNRKRTGKADPASKGFTQEFTEKFDMIADATPVFHEMRNLFDMSIAAAFIQDRDLYEKAGWNLGAFEDESRFAVNRGSEVSQVETAINAVWKDSQLMTPIGGGVHIAARKLIDPSAVTIDQEVETKLEKMGAPADLQQSQWWWD